MAPPPLRPGVLHRFTIVDRMSRSQTTLDVELIKPIAKICTSSLSRIFGLLTKGDLMKSIFHDLPTTKGQSGRHVSQEMFALQSNNSFLEVPKFVLYGNALLKPAMSKGVCSEKFKRTFCTSSKGVCSEELKRTFCTSSKANEVKKPIPPPEIAPWLWYFWHDMNKVNPRPYPKWKREAMNLMFRFMRLSNETRNNIYQGLISFSLTTTCGSVFWLVKSMIIWVLVLVAEGEDTPLEELKIRVVSLEMQLDAKESEVLMLNDLLRERDAEIKILKEVVANRMPNVVLTSDDLFAWLMLFAKYVQPSLRSSFDLAEADGMSYWRLI